MERSRDMVIGKGAFPSLWLADWLEQGYDRVELAGLVSYLCVLSNAAIMVKAACPPGRRSWWMPPLHRRARSRISTPRAWT